MPKEQIRIVIEAIVVQAVLAYCFYQSIWAFIGLIPIGIYYYRHKLVVYEEKKKEEITMEFKEMIQAISTSLRAGYSLENACRESLQEMELLYGKEAALYKELDLMVQKLRNNQTIESLFQELAGKLQVVEIGEFAQILVVAKRYGGDLSKIIQNTSDAIRDKIDVNREIAIVISGKKAEQAVMNVVPLGIIGYMQVTTPGFFDPLYHNVMGVVIMSVCLCLYLVAYFLSRTILQINI